MNERAIEQDRESPDQMLSQGEEQTELVTGRTQVQEEEL
jgi:hypothetical protein